MQREIGRFHKLNVLETGTHSAILDGEQWGRLPLSLEQCPESLKPGDQLEVFIYLDSEGSPAPTTLRPYAELGQVAWLKIVDVNSVGAFADWGLPKDLFIPFAEQQYAVSKGDHTLAKVYVDNQGRLAGSTRIDHWIEDTSPDLKQGQKVSLIIADRTELGFKAVINHECWGLLYSNELHQRISKGQVLDGYIQRIRDDRKIDLSLNQPGFSKGKMDDISIKILAALQESEGFLALTDKSPPHEIYAAFAVSKKVFKQAIGALYKQRVIALESGGIRLL
ncbi:MAG: putative RNA-binding protein (virulence factor B family) [Halieaceae bacterium]|jgi:predicted RNA-binding protein (virulence factor B family)